MRATGPVDREKVLPKLANNSSIQCDDRTTTIGLDGWEKSKTKKRSTKLVDGHRELKQGIQERLINGARPRSSNEAHGFRYIS